MSLPEQTIAERERERNSRLAAATRKPGKKREPNPVKKVLDLLGPGFTTGASDDDPTGIGTYATSGASLGFATLWTALLTFPLMASVQFICAKVGMVTGHLRFCRSP